MSYLLLGLCPKDDTICLFYEQNFLPELSLAQYCSLAECWTVPKILNVETITSLRYPVCIFASIVQMVPYHPDTQEFSVNDLGG